MSLPCVCVTANQLDALRVHGFCAITEIHCPWKGEIDPGKTLILAMEEKHYPVRILSIQDGSEKGFVTLVVAPALSL